MTNRAAPVPRPPEGPDREALRALSEAATPGPWWGRYGTVSPRGNEVWGISPDVEDGHRRVLHDADTLSDADWSLIIHAVNYVRAALLPTPPTAGDTPTDAEVAAALRILAPGDDDNVTLGEIRADLAAPGDREGLRAAAEAVRELFGQGCLNPPPMGITLDSRTCGTCANCSRDWTPEAAAILRAALAARDTDQGAGHARNPVHDIEIHHRLIDTGAHDNPGVTCPRCAALARATPKAGEEKS